MPFVRRRSKPTVRSPLSVILRISVLTGGDVADSQKMALKRKQHTGSTGLVQEPWSLFKTPCSGPGASGRWSLPSAFRSTKSPLGAAGCRRPPPRVNGGRRRRGARADPASRAGVSCWRCFCLTWTQRWEERPFAAGEVLSCHAPQKLTTLRRGRERRLRKLRVLSFATPQA